MWFHGNMTAHGDSLSAPYFVAKRCKMLFNDFILSKSPMFVSNQVQSLQWSPPHAGWIKINSDASFDAFSDRVGIAAVAHDHNSRVIGVFLDFMDTCSSPVEAEIRGFELAFSLAVRKGASRVVVETDSVVVLQCFYGQVSCPLILSSIVDRCWALLCRMESWKLFAIRREANVFADSIAAFAAINRQMWFRLNACPWLSKDGNPGLY